MPQIRIRGRQREFFVGTKNKFRSAMNHNSLTHVIIPAHHSEGEYCLDGSP